MGQALYRKNRPKSLDGVVGQEHITSTLKNALKKGAISHAYLFTGPRGVGKTSVARILAHDVNGIPYTDDSMHLDIIEIDAASNRRIDEIRDLRDRVNVAPTSAKYKVYIIDEVHMLTREAFNALLKTLEEPPAHVVFILATTESHKLPPTIVSRTQRFTFKPIPLETVVGHLRDIATQEKIDITDGALELIAKHGDGSFRDSISLLDQASGSHVKIDASYVRTMIGIPSEEAVSDLKKSLDNRDSAQVVHLLEILRDQGFGAAHIARQLGEAYRAKLIETGSAQPSDIDLLQKLLRVPAAHDPDKYFEIILLEYALSGGAARLKPMPHPAVSDARVEPPKKSEHIAAKKIEKPRSETANKAPKPQSTDTQTHGSATIDNTVWPRVLAELKKKYNTLYGVVRMAKPTFDGDELELGFAFAFHRKRLSEKKNRQIVEDIIRGITGRNIIIRCVDDSSAHFSSSTAPASNGAAKLPDSTGRNTAPDLASISNIFGGGEILEQ